MDSSAKGMAQPVTSNENFDFDRKNLDNCDPELCIRILNRPNVTNFAGIGTRLKSSNEKWMSEFLKMDGLLLLTGYLTRIGDRQPVGHADDSDGSSFECIGCIKAILNRASGLKFLLQKKNQNLVENILLGLNSANIKTKMAVIEILSVISLYSQDGCLMVITALQFYKTTKQQSHKFSVIIDALEKSNSLQYKSTLLGFVNCLICGNKNLTERCQLREEFIDLGFLDILDQLSDEDDDAIMIQVQVFDKFKMDDEENVLDNVDGKLATGENKNRASERESSVLTEKSRLESDNDLSMAAASPGLPSAVEADSDGVVSCDSLIDDIWNRISTGSEWLKK